MDQLSCNDMAVQKKQLTCMHATMQLDNLIIITGAQQNSSHKLRRWSIFLNCLTPFHIIIIRTTLIGGEIHLHCPEPLLAVSPSVR